MVSNKQAKERIFVSRNPEISGRNPDGAGRKVIYLQVVDSLAEKSKINSQQSLIVNNPLSFSLMKKKQKIKTWDFRRSK